MKFQKKMYQSCDEINYSLHCLITHSLFCIMHPTTYLVGCVIQKRCIHTLALDPMLLHHSRVMGASSGNGSKVTGSTSVLRVKRTLRNFFLSPINIALATQGNCFLIVSSMGIGATFSPPAVIRISLARPEILEI